MNAQDKPEQDPQSASQARIRELYQEMLATWNRRAAHDMAALFADDGNLIGFDGSQVDGRVAIESHLSGIFANHMTAAYVGKVRDVRFLTPDVAVLRAVVGMVPPGKSDLNPNVNAIQTLVALRQANRWYVAV